MATPMRMVNGSMEKTVSDMKAYVVAALGIFAIFAFGIAIDGGTKARCKYTAMEKHYSADDIIKLCGR